MNKLELLLLLSKAEENKENIVLTVKREDLIFPLLLENKDLNKAKEKIKNTYTENLISKDNKYQILKAENEIYYCKEETEKKLKELLRCFKIVEKLQYRI